MLADTRQMTDEFEELRQRQEVSLHEHHLLTRLPCKGHDVGRLLGDGRLAWIEVVVIPCVSSYWTGPVWLFEAAEAQLKVFDDQLAHLLWKCSLRWQLL